MKRKRNPVARNPLLGKGGAHGTSKTERRRQAKNALLDEIEIYFEESQKTPREGGGNSAALRSVFFGCMQFDTAPA